MAGALDGKRGGRKLGAETRRSAWPTFLTTHAIVVARIGACLAAAGLPQLAWYDVLWALDRAPDGQRRMHELSELTSISRTNITRLVDRLEAAGLAARDRACTDRRGAYAVITPAGRAMRRKMWAVYGPAIGALFDRHLRPEESEQLRGMLMRILSAARAEANFE
jgi:DNA-binding MarR family transcriptional regulator